MSEPNELPTHADCCQIIEEGGKPTALEQFVYDYEPAGKNDEEAFRASLLAVVRELREAA